MLKKLLFLIILTCINGLICHAQIKDKISEKEFVNLSYKQMYPYYESDLKAQSFIKWNKFFRNTSYVLLPYGLLLAIFSPTKNNQYLNGVAVFTWGSIFYLNSSKKKLYKKLINYELIKYAKQSNSTFDIRLEDFKKTSWKNIRKKYVYNETTQYIFDYCNKKTIQKKILAISGSVLIVSGIGLSVSKLLQNSPETFENGFPIVFFTVFYTLPGSILLYSGLHNRREFNKEILYSNLSLYYHKGTVSKEVQDYILKHDR
jgi:hypothetical protein